jgi:hypothetical protein
MRHPALIGLGDIKSSGELRLPFFKGHVWERGCGCGCVPKKFEIFFFFTKI